mgnify:CR=1 FL=1
MRKKDKNFGNDKTGSFEMKKNTTIVIHNVRRSDVNSLELNDY